MFRGSVSEESKRYETHLPSNERPAAIFEGNFVRLILDYVFHTLILIVIKSSFFRYCKRVLINTSKISESTYLLGNSSFQVVVF